MFGVNRPSAQGAAMEPRVPVTQRGSKINKVAKAAITDRFNPPVGSKKLMGGKVAVSNVDSELMETIVGLQEEIAKLKNVIQIMQEDSTESNAVKKYLDSLNGELADAKTENSLLKKENESLRTNYRQLQERFNALEEDCVMVIMPAETEETKT